MSMEVIIGLLVLFAVVFLLVGHVRKSKAKKPTTNPGAGGGGGGNPDRIDVDKV